MDAYKDRETLKDRLQKLAQTITTHFLQAKGRHKQQSAVSRDSSKAALEESHSKSRALNLNDASLREFIRANPHSNHFEAASHTMRPLADPKTSFARSGMLHSVHASQNESLHRMLAGIPTEGPSRIASLGPMQLNQHYGLHHDYQQQQPQPQPQLQPFLPTSYTSESGVAVQQPLLDPASAPLSKEMQDILTSQLLAQQQQIISNIRQQEELIRHLQNSRSNQYGDMLSGSVLGTNPPLYQSLQPSLFQGSHPLQPQMPVFEYQTSLDMLDSTRQMVMNGNMMRYQQGPNATNWNANDNTVQSIPSSGMVPTDGSLDQLAAIAAHQTHVSSHALAPEILHPPQLQRSNEIPPAAMLNDELPPALLRNNEIPYASQLAMPSNESSFVTLDAALAAHEAKVGPIKLKQDDYGHNNGNGGTKLRKKGLSKDSFCW